MHYGAVFAPSVVAIFGKTNVDTWRPYRQNAIVMTAESKVANDVTVEAVYKSLTELLR